MTPPAHRRHRLRRLRLPHDVPGELPRRRRPRTACSRLSVSFLVDAMRRVRGGVAPNIAYGLALFGLKPVIMATAGADALDYARWLAEEGVDTSALRHQRRPLHRVVLRLDRRGSEPDRDLLHGRDGPARGRCPSGPSARARSRSPSSRRTPRRRWRQVRGGVPDAPDPVRLRPEPAGRAARGRRSSSRGSTGPPSSSRTSTSSGSSRRRRGSRRPTSSRAVPVLIVTRGEDGSTIALRGGSPRLRATGHASTSRPRRCAATAVDPTGVGDAFRAGLLAARQRGLPWDVAGRVGSVAAVYALETIGAPAARATRSDDFLERYRENYGLDGRARSVDRLRAGA